MKISKSHSIKSFIVIGYSLVLFGVFYLDCRKSVDAGAGSDPSDLLPVKDDISGFQKNGGNAIMTDLQSITAAIDGAAEVYYRGFIEGTQQMYGNGSIDIDIRIMNYSTVNYAKRVYQEFYPSSPEAISSGAPEVVIEHALLTGYSLYYTKETLFIEIHTFEKSNFALNMAKQFCWNIDKKVGTPK